MAIAPAAHARFQVGVVQKLAPVAAGVLDTLVGVDEYLLPGPAPPDGHQQRIDHQVGTWVALHTPADDLA